MSPDHEGYVIMFKRESVGAGFALVSLSLWFFRDGQEGFSRCTIQEMLG